jgi:predicted nucleotidyltransferase component of viral defense system
MVIRDAITQWAKVVPWISMQQVEQDLLISRAIIAIFNDDFLYGKLAFHGGTALHKLYFSPSPRYSEDIDLVQKEPEPIGPVINKLREALNFLGEPQVKQKRNNNTMIYKFTTTYPPQADMHLKIEINCMEHFTVLGYKKMPFSMSNQWFNGSCEASTYAIDELLCTKFRALYQRRKGRDLFDMFYSLSKAKTNSAQIINCYNQYMTHSVANPPTQRVFLENLENKMQNKAFREDTAFILAPNISFDPDESFELICNELISKMA